VLYIVCITCGICNTAYATFVVLHNLQCSQYCRLAQLELCIILRTLYPINLLQTISWRDFRSIFAPLFSVHQRRSCCLSSASLFCLLGVDVGRLLVTNRRLLERRPSYPQLVYSPTSILHRQSLHSMLNSQYWNLRCQRYNLLFVGSRCCGLSTRTGKSMPPSTTVAIEHRKHQTDWTTIAQCWSSVSSAFDEYIHVIYYFSLNI